ncbi:MAG: hypothetical protein JWL59_5189 [Chthoniobacteraceae bacterium]|nr:hypothetical protein [Chthoniobacteraceae bacterium]
MSFENHQKLSFVNSKFAETLPPVDPDCVRTLERGFDPLNLASTPITE